MTGRWERNPFVPSRLARQWRALEQDNMRWNQHRSPELVEGRFSDVALG
jgi:hypothetical protein